MLLMRNILLWITLILLIVGCNEKNATEPEEQSQKYKLIFNKALKVILLF